MLFEERITTEASKKLQSLGFDSSDIKEKVHTAMNSIQSFAHEYVYDKHPYINYSQMKKAVIKMIAALFD